MIRQIRQRFPSQSFPPYGSCPRQLIVGNLGAFFVEVKLFLLLYFKLPKISMQCAFHACHTIVHFQGMCVHMCGLIVAIHVWIIHVWSTYGEPHLCVLLQNGSSCRKAGLHKIDHLSTKLPFFHICSPLVTIYNVNTLNLLH